MKTTSSDDPLIQPDSRRHIDMPSMQPAEFLNVNYTLSSLDVRQFKEAERKGYNKETPEFAGFQTGQNTRDIHFKRLGYTATTTKFAHLRFRFNVSDTILVAKQVSDAANHYLHSMQGKGKLGTTCRSVTHFPTRQRQSSRGHRPCEPTQSQSTLWRGQNVSSARQQV